MLSTRFREGDQVQTSCGDVGRVVGEETETLSDMTVAEYERRFPTSEPHVWAIWRGESVASFYRESVVSLVDPAPTGGVKFDAGKPAMGLLNEAALEAWAEALGIGAEKYGQWNYRQGMEATRLLGAAMRHLAALLEGRDDGVDEKTGRKYKHAGAAMANLGMLLDLQRRGALQDDRLPAEKKEK